MGLDITALIKSRTDLNKETEYRVANWPKVESGEMSENDYYHNYPRYSPRWINVTEYGIRNWWGLRTYLMNNMGLGDHDVYNLEREQLETLRKAAIERAIPAGNTCNYEGKVDELLGVIARAFKECDFDNNVVTIQFCY